jgi:hypothetical protein
VRLRVAAAVLLALAAIVYAAGTVPLQRKAAAAADAYRRARDERRVAHARLGQAQRRESALRRASPVRAAGDGAPADPVGATRHGIVASLEGAGLSGVRLAVRPGTPPAAAEVQLSLEGPFRDVVRLSGELVRPGSGFVLERFRLNGHAAGQDAVHDPRVAMTLQGAGLEVSP